MNQSFSSLFKNRVSPIVLPRGFKLYKRIYYRVINGVLQCFTLERFDTMLHVRFSLAPICLSMDKEEFVNFPLRELSQYVDPPQGCCWWSTDDWTETLDKMADGIQNFLLPLFDGATSAKAAYEALIRCDMQVYERWMNSFSYVVFNIIAGDYETAEKHMQAIIEAYRIPRLPSGEIDWAGFAQKRGEEYAASIHRSYDEDVEMLERIKARDTAYWDAYIRTGSDEMMQFLNTLPGVKRQKKLS